MNERKIVITIFILLLSLLITLHVSAAPKQEITVAAAMSLKAPFEDMGRIFMEKNGDIKVLFNFNSSGRLRQQIESGAPLNVFASASMKEMNRLSSMGIVDEETKRVFAGNMIVLVIPSKAAVRPRSFFELEKKDIDRIVIGNPKTTPIGMYSQEVLMSTGVWDRVKEKTVFAEHVRQILDYVARGEVDAGLVYSTDAKIREKELTVVLSAPKGSHRTISYPIAVIKNADSEKAAERFIAFVLSERGRDILRAHGFILPKKKG